MRTSGGVYHASLKAKPEMMIVAHDFVRTSYTTAMACMGTAAKTDIGSVPAKAGTKSAGYSRQVAKLRNRKFSRNVYRLFCLQSKGFILPNRGRHKTNMILIRTISATGEK